MNLSRRGPILAGLLLLSLLVGAGCGYHLAGTGGPSVIPEHVKIIVVVPFENRTTRPEIEQRVTEEVARELSQRGKYEVVIDKTQYRSCASTPPAKRDNKRDL